MRSRHRARSLVRVAAGLALLLGFGAALAEGLASPRVDDAFWKHWGDGRAELAGYELTFSRYGEERAGTAVTVSVTEPFSETGRVKSEQGDGDDRFQVLKLNLMQDFPTGVYDYNMMTSAFLALEPRAGLESGRLAKVSFSSQEWCGHVYAQTWFEGGRAFLDSHSYFEGEADERRELALGDATLPEEALFFWARGLAAPRMAPGDRLTVSLLRSLEEVRLRHRPLDVRPVELRRGNAVETVEVPAGRFRVRRDEVRSADGSQLLWSFWVEAEAPHRLIRWEHAGGGRAELLGSDRVAYWGMNRGSFTGALESLGLRRRPPRTP